MEESWLHPVVGIDERDVFAAGLVDAAVAGGRDTGIWLVDDTNDNFPLLPR